MYLFVVVCLQFQGNADSNTPVTVYFPAALQTRFIQIEPVTWYNWPCMRFELLGCRGNVFHFCICVGFYELKYCT